MSAETELQELEERVEELEEQQSEPVTLSRRAILGLLSVIGFGGLAATQPTTAQTTTKAKEYCTLKGPVASRPTANKNCRYLFFEGDEDETNQQVIRYIDTETATWKLFDNVPKNLYGRGYPDHPDYASLTDVLNDVSAAILGPNQYGDINTGDGKTLQGAGFGSKIGNLTAGLDNTVFFLEIEGTSSIGNRNQILAIFALDNDVTITGNLNKYSMGTHLSNTVVVDGDSNTITASSGASTLIPWNITLNGDDNVVDGNTNVSVTDNGSGNIVGDNT